MRDIERGAILEDVQDRPRAIVGENPACVPAPEIFPDLTDPLGVRAYSPVNIGIQDAFRVTT